MGEVWAFLSFTHALDAYTDLGFGTNTVYVVDIDTGINMAHEEFKTEGGESIVEYAKSAFDSDGDYVGDGNGFINIPAGENWDDNGHGTHTAGIIAARGNNDKGVAGVAWKNVKLISYKCFSENSPYSGADWPIYGVFGFGGMENQ